MAGRMMLGIVALALATTAWVVLLDPPNRPGSGWIAGLGCSEGPLATYAPGSYLYPYGRVRSCRVLDRHAPWFGGVDAQTYLLLDTDVGAAAVRVDYRNHNAGWQYTANAVEFAAADVPGELSAEELADLRSAVRARGTVAAQPWTLHYGDG